MKLLFSCACLILIFSLPAGAEYRAFLLQIKGAGGNVERTFKSSLDPDQYQGFFPLEQGENITYIDTWMCQGRTGNFQPICPSPHATVEDSARLPASVSGP
jgi:hypothetical protein